MGRVGRVGADCSVAEGETEAQQVGHLRQAAAPPVRQPACRPAVGLRGQPLVRAAVAGQRSPERYARRYIAEGIGREPIEGCHDIGTDAATQRSAVRSRSHSTPNTDGPPAPRSSEPPMKTKQLPQLVLQRSHCYCYC